MPPHPKEPHLFEVVCDGSSVAVIRAASTAEARDFALESFLLFRRLTPSQAFRAGAEGAEIHNAKPEYAVFDEEGAQGDLLDDGSEIDTDPVIPDAEGEPPAHHPV